MSNDKLAHRIRVAVDCYHAATIARCNAFGNAAHYNAMEAENAAADRLNELLQELSHEAEKQAGPVAGIVERIEAALQRIEDGHGIRRIPADPTDPDLVLAECKAFFEGRDAPFWVKPPVQNTAPPSPLTAQAGPVATQAPAPAPQMPAGWADAYAAFQGAFDTPLARRRMGDEFCQDARRRLREFNDAVLAAVPSPLSEQAGPMAGWKLMPPEPTAQMKGAAHAYASSVEDPSPTGMYAAMFAVAPPSPLAEQDKVDAADFRWLTKSDRGSLVWSHVLTDEEKTGCRSLQEAIRAARAKQEQQ